MDWLMKFKKVREIIKVLSPRKLIDTRWLDSLLVQICYARFSFQILLLGLKFDGLSGIFDSLK